MANNRHQKGDVNFSHKCHSIAAKFVVWYLLFYHAFVRKYDLCYVLQKNDI